MKVMNSRLACMIGNALEHYDSALFGLLTPFISTLFFDVGDPVTALLYTYLMFPISFIARPFGSLFFGYMGDRRGRKQVLCWSLIGMAIVTTIMGFLPTYKQAGLIAPLLLLLSRMLQNFFAAGEAIASSVFVMEKTQSSNKSFFASIYNASTMLGILVGSALVTLLGYYNMVEQGWRYLFWLGGITAVFGLFLRLGIDDSRPIQQMKKPPLSILKEHKAALLHLVLASGFSYVTYSMAFTLMNGYVPLVTNISKTEIMGINTYLLVVDFLLLPGFGYLGDKIGKERLMFLAACLLAVTSIPLFSFLDKTTLLGVIFIRFMVLFLGVAYAAPYHAWAVEQVPPEYRCTILALSNALGAQCIGSPTAPCSIWIYQKTGFVAAPGIYLALSALLASYAIFQSIKQKAVVPAYKL